MTLRGRLLLAAALLATAGVALAAGALWRDWHTPYKGYEDGLILEIPRGRGAGLILDELANRGVVRSRFSLKLAYTATGRLSTMKAGKYLFDRPLTPLEVLAKLRKGEVLLTRVTLPEGLRLDEAAALFAEEGLGRRESFRAAMRDPATILDLDPRARDLEGYLFPDTYFVDPGTSEEAIVRLLARSFREWWAHHSAAASGRLDLRGVVTLASVVERETASPSERPRIAGLFLNRLRIGMPLQSDPTVIYALVSDGVYRGRLLREDWGYAHPYNTYRNAGLPPGPICSPGRASLEAVLSPEKTPYLYFVAKTDGTHVFSATLDEHNRAVARYRGGGGQRP